VEKNKDKFFEIKDYEVFGISAERKALLQELHQSTAFKLLVHGGSFLSGVAEQTLSWLQPETTENRILHNPTEKLHQRFRQIFSRGQALLGDLKDKILDDYLQEMPWQEGLIDDHFRYFAFFLRTRFPSHQNWQEVFICEWCRWSRSYLDLPWSEKPEKTRAQGFELNPSLQFYRLGTEAAGFLETEAGLYACFYQAEARKTRDHKVQKEQARALDLLEEEMGFSREKILQVLTEDLKSAEIAEATLHSLQTLGVLR
jgi:hypothetical protein